MNYGQAMALSTILMAVCAASLLVLEYPLSGRRRSRRAATGRMGGGSMAMGRTDTRRTGTRRTGTRRTGSGSRAGGETARGSAVAEARTGAFPEIRTGSSPAAGPGIPKDPAQLTEPPRNARSESPR
jgi:hypothetical protein